MITKENILFDIGKKEIDEILDQLFGRIGFLFNRDRIIDQVYKETEQQKGKFKELEEKIQIEEFKQFLQTPQVNDLLRNYMLYLLIITITGSRPKKGILEDDVICCLTDIIENNFSSLNDEESIDAIKKFFELLFGICSKDGEVYWADFIVRDKDVLQYLFTKELLEEKQLFGKIIEKINFAFEQEFIPRNLKFEKIKTNYTKALKQYYQNGFIYLLGEYKFNEFYIPPVLIDGDKKSLFRGRPYITDREQREKLKKMRENWKHIFDTKDIIYVIGGAGYGKSLFLKILLTIIRSYIWTAVRIIWLYIVI